MAFIEIVAVGTLLALDLISRICPRRHLSSFDSLAAPLNVLVLVSVVAALLIKLFLGQFLLTSSALAPAVVTLTASWHSAILANSIHLLKP